MTIQDINPTLVEAIPVALAKFDLTEATIEKMREEGLALRTKGVDDHEALALVHNARMAVKAHRVAVEKTRKALKADALEYGKRVDGEARRLTSLLRPIEDHLQAEEDLVAKEKARIKEEERQAAKAELERRAELLGSLGRVLPSFELEAMTLGEFEAELVAAQEAHEKRQKAEAQEKAKREAEEAEAKRKADEEAAKVKAERAELEKLRAEQLQREEKAAAERRADQAKIDAEKEKLRKERAEIELERVRCKEEERRAQIEESNRQAREEQARLDKEEAERRAEADRLARTHTCPKCAHEWVEGEQ